MKNFSAKFSKYFLYIEFAKEVKYFNIELFIDLNNCWFTLEKKHNLQTQDIPNLKCRYYDPYRILYRIDFFFFFFPFSRKMLQENKEHDHLFNYIENWCGDAGKSNRMEKNK